eukprot:7040311-Prymnesium_polylepis.4
MPEICLEQGASVESVVSVNCPSNCLSSLESVVSVVTAPIHYVTAVTPPIHYVTAVTAPSIT